MTELIKFNVTAEHHCDVKHVFICIFFNSFHFLFYWNRWSYRIGPGHRKPSSSSFLWTDGSCWWPDIASSDWGFGKEAPCPSDNVRAVKQNRSAAIFNPLLLLNALKCSLLLWVNVSIPHLCCWNISFTVSIKSVFHFLPQPIRWGPCSSSLMVSSMQRKPSFMNNEANWERRKKSSAARNRR